MKSAAELVSQDEWPLANREGRPFVIYKFASTLDGRIAAEDGTSQWITSDESRAEVHVLRAGCEATMIGSGTQQMDNPSLSVRANGDPRLVPAMTSFENQPLRVVVDTNARTSAEAKILHKSAPTLIVIAEDADAQHLEDSIILRIPRSSRGLNLQLLLTKLYERGIRAVFLEGGPTLAGSFIANGLVDRVICYLAPALLGAGKAGLGYAGIASIDDMMRLELCDVARVGSDLRIIAKTTW
ncbi:MAG: bifunctional diaminohydroxyphosphoribosylaminopyrimidine deaminase/5-amino-6-(5-phosphoribosylamino)uracil reductase RibD [Myxococcales bacterium]|nr:bifunctional diaminohydroxyphosphoribosylaminopyrimidine deaminase/5-amino-6-(5-phosphoribosylamino)uracil reductase RibD [Myxococcales bacterium]